MSYVTYDLIESSFSNFFAVQMPSDRDWMYDRVCYGFLCDEFRRGVVEFLEFAYCQFHLIDPDGKIICLCKKCQLLKKFFKEDVNLHLY